MAYDTQQELESCLHICDQLEELLKKDSLEIEQCMTGMLCEEYRKNVQQNQSALADIRRQISKLHNFCAEIV